jgi:hypothetical protein
MRIHSWIGSRGAVLSLLLFASGCGGSTSGNPDGATDGVTGGLGASGVESSKRLITLSDAEKGLLCDWMVAQAGSYGVPGTCDRTQPAATYPFLAYDDQAACIEDARDPTDTGCQATVGQFEACVSLLPACATLTQAMSIPACAAISGC